MHLSKKKQRTNQFFALLLSGFFGLVYVLVVWEVSATNYNLFLILMAIGGLTMFSLYSNFTRKYRERVAFTKKPFPEAWRKILVDYVQFYNMLSEEEKRRFEIEIMIFLHETRVTGIKTEVDDLTLVLTAASAEIPVFNFPEWEYHNLGEVLIYPDSFSKDFRMEGEGRNIGGMVGTGSMQGMMILSKPALVGGFQRPNDRYNVGIHEFAHLIDAADGSYDGVPQVFLNNRYLEPWMRVMHQEIKRIKSGKSTMNPYGGTSEVEFFAVASEYFFEDPIRMQKEKPELYELLSIVYQQDTGQRFKNIFKSMFAYNGRRISNRATCPCKSGKLYKDCCLKNARLH